MSEQTSKQIRRKRRKLEREREARSQRLRSRLRLITFFVVAILLLLIFGPTLYRNVTQDTLPGTPVPVQGNTHLDSVTSPHPPYNSVPPTSGWHVNQVAAWGVHKEPVPDELQVHNLEDGGVMVQYNCADCPDLIQQLEALAEQYDRVVVAPYPDMEHRIALTAWGRLLPLQEYDEEAITRFIRAHHGRDHHPRTGGR